MAATSIRGDTAAGAGHGSLTAIHLPREFKVAPTGADTKSAAIAAQVAAVLGNAHDGINIYNTSVDTLRRGLVAAPAAVEATDTAGAATVAASGKVVTI